MLEPPYLNPRAPDTRAASLPSDANHPFAGLGAEGLLAGIASLSPEESMTLSPDGPNLPASRSRGGDFGVA